MGNEQWKDSWKGHYQDKDNPHQAKIFCEEHKTENDMAKEHPFKYILSRRKNKRKDSLFIQYEHNQRQAERDLEIEERIENGEGSDVMKELIGKAVIALIVIVIISLVMRGI